MEDKILLIKTDTNWADEMDINGFFLCTESAWKDYQEKVKAYEGYIEVHFGTNELNEYRNAEQYFSDIFREPICLDSQELETIKKCFDLNNVATDLLAEHDCSNHFTYAQHCLLDSYQLEED